MQSHRPKLMVLLMASPTSSISIIWDSLDVQILGPNLRAPESDTGGWGPAVYALANPPDDSDK